MRLLTVVCAFLAACAVAQAYITDSSIYGAQLLKLTCDTNSKLKIIRNYEGKEGFDFLMTSRNRPLEVLVAADHVDPFKLNLLTYGIKYQVVVDDVSKVIEEELVLQNYARQQRTSDTGISFKSFPLYNEIVEYLKSLAGSYSDLVEVFSIGKSFEGRDIFGVKISSGGEDKPALLIDAGIHAREWIAPTTALYAINQLVENVTNHYIFDNIDIYVIPSLNPDGYSYTHKSASTRMWRKTRSTNPKSRCLGVDPNRNFGYKWMTVGASPEPCSETYAGTKPFSEPETAALRDFVLARKGLFKVYLTMHSYGNYLLYPWGYTSKVPANEPTLRCVAEHAEAELSKVRGTRYSIGSSTNVLYAAAGGSDDWVMAEGGAELSYTMELPGGRYGFAPPPKDIIPVGEESFEAIKVFAKAVEGGMCQESRR